MCGINGFIGRNSVENAEQRIRRMNNSIKHRGPDADGYVAVENGKVLLGQCRLSILDLDERSNQPMQSDHGNILIYNGEIYNFREIKDELKGYCFHTKSDTEVLLAGIELNGIEWMLSRSNGMFAFAYYDASRHELYLARDRMGIKPLYYYRDNEKFVFSSEIKGILNSGLVKAEFNEGAVDEYLANRYVRAPYTFFENIYQVEAGTFLTINETGYGLSVSIKRYWDLPNHFNMDIQYDENEIMPEFEKRIETAIVKRMIADVPVGTYLSGGVDSSLISAIAACSFHGQINTYTIGFPEINEFKYAREVAEKYQTKHHEILMEKAEYFDSMRELISYKDAPLGVPNEIPLALMSRELKKEITVVLSGEGADELMGGYGRIFRSAFDYTNLSFDENISFYDYFIGLYEYVPREIRDKYLNVGHSMRYSMDTLIRKEFNDHPNEENVFRFFHKYHVKGLLQRVDTTTMLAGVEARVPFLDHELIEYVYREIPYDLKIKWKENIGICSNLGTAKVYSELLDTPKYLLKKLSCKYLPEDVVYRKKMGFPVPLEKWIENLSEMAEDLLKDAYWIQTSRLAEMLKDCAECARGGQIIWMLINVEVFRKMYFDKEWRY